VVEVVKPAMETAKYAVKIARPAIAIVKLVRKTANLQCIKIPVAL